MSTRRRWGIALVLVCVLLVIAVVGFGSRGGKAEVKLFVLRYTNVFLHHANNLLSSSARSCWQQRAVLIVTNAGSRSVSFVPVPVDYRRYRILHSGDISLTNLPPVLKARRSVAVEIDTELWSNPRRVCVAYTSPSVSQRWLGRARNSPIKLVQTMANRYYTQPKIYKAFSDSFHEQLSPIARPDLSVPQPPVSLDFVEGLRLD